MQKRKVLVVCSLLSVLFAVSLSAGDVASFVDLGFSPDGTRYMFAQYGVQTGTLKPWAELFLVDVPRNNFVSGGRLSYIHDKAVFAGQDGSGAFYKLLAQNAALAEQHNIDFLRQSQPLYIAMDNGEHSVVSGDSVEFRDFEGGVSYKADLVPYVEGSGDSLKSSFYINLERKTANGTVKNYVVGTPQIKRPLIESYRIRRAVIAPRDGSLIFVIEMKKRSASGHDIRYMVEAVRF